MTRRVIHWAAFVVGIALLAVPLAALVHLVSSSLSGEPFSWRGVEPLVVIVVVVACGQKWWRRRSERRTAERAGDCAPGSAERSRHR